jgi:hypothetical protein
MIYNLLSTITTIATIATKNKHVLDSTIFGQEYSSFHS